MIERGDTADYEQIQHHVYLCQTAESAIGRPGIIATPLITSPEGVIIIFP